MFRRTNLYNIVQNTDERVAILNQVIRVISPSTHMKTTYFLNTWNLCHLYLIPPTVVGVIRLGFCCSPEVLGPEERALCSEAPDEDALIPGQWLFIALVQ